MLLVGVPMVFATYPATPYAPGEELDPACVPLSTNCYVDVSLSASNGLSLNGTSGDVELGGVLDKNTSITGLFGFKILGVGDYEISTTESSISGSSGSLRLNASSDKNIVLDINGVDISSGVLGDVFLSTQGVNNSTSLNGQVLTLIDETTGQAEWTTLAPGSGTNIYNLSGSLTSSRSVNGNGNNIQFMNFSDITLSSYTSNAISITTSGVTLNVGSADGLFIKTPAVQGSSAVNGQALTLINATAGKVEYQNAATRVLPAYADDVVAGVGGLATGEYYQTDGTGASPLNIAGIVMIKQ